MPVASRSQCRNPRGFSQIASCKAQGLIPRTSRKYAGKYVKSAKYKKVKRSKKTASHSRKSKGRSQK